MSPIAASETWPVRLSLAAVAAITIAAFALRLLPIGESLWVDELHTAWCAVGSLSEVAPRAAIGNQSPLYFWLQWLLVRVLGLHEIAVRLPSLLAGSLLPLAVFLTARRFISSGVGFLAAALIAIDPTAIFYATEARPYALVQLLAVIHSAVTAEIVTNPTIALRASWVAIGALLFHLHYTAALLIPAELVFYGLVAIIRPPAATYRWTSLAWDSAILAALCLPAIGVLQAIFSRRANWAAFIPLSPFSTIIMWWPYALGLAYIAAALATHLARAKSNEIGPLDARRLSFAILLLCWLLVPTILAWVAAKSGVARLFFERYLLVCAPAAVLLAASCAQLAPWQWGKLTVGLLLLSVALWSGGVLGRLFHDGRVIPARGEDWRGCVAWLNQELPRTQFPVLVWSGLIEADALRQPHDELLDDYCLLPVTSLYPLDTQPDDMFPLPMHQPGRLDQVVEMLVVHRGGAWLIVRADQQTGQSIAKSIIDNLEKSSVPGIGAKWQIQDNRSFGRVQVLLLTTKATRQHELGSQLAP